MPTVERMRVDAITPYAGNPRRHNARQVARLATSIRRFGRIVPLVVDAQGVLVAGHARHAAAVAGLSSLVHGPLYLACWSPPDLPARLWVEQALFQGVVGWWVAFVTFGATVRALGPGPAAIFSALVPPLAVVIGMPATGTWPDPLQWLGVGLASLGLVASLDLAARARPA